MRPMHETAGILAIGLTLVGGAAQAAGSQFAEASIQPRETRPMATGKP